MSESKTTQTQQAFSGWTMNLDAQIDQLAGMFDELGKLETRNMERVGETVDELTKLAHAQLALVAELGVQSRRILVAAAKQGAQMFGAGA